MGPTGPLDEMDLDDDSQLTKKAIFKKFAELKAAGEIKINKKLKGLSLEKFPILCKEGDLRIEELQPTETKELKVIISEKGSKNNSRKVSHQSGEKASQNNSPWVKAPAQYKRKTSENN